MDRITDTTHLSSLEPLRAVSFSQNHNLKATVKAIQSQKWVDAYEELMAYFEDVALGRVVEGMQLACQCWRDVFPHLHDPQKELLLKERCLKALEPFVELSAEQLNIAIDLAQWHHKHHPNDAVNTMCYYAQALKIADRYHPDRLKEVHRHASKLIMQVLQKNLHLELEKARRNDDADAFDAILKRLDTLEGYCTDEEDTQGLKVLYREARSVLNQKSTIGKKFIPLWDKIQQKFQQETPVLQFLITEKYWQALKEFRNEFEAAYREAPLSDASSVRQFQKMISGKFIVFLRHTIFQGAFDILGCFPPCNYELVAMGSLAKEEICPFSDLEWFILIEDEKHRDYFRCLASVVELLVASLGETAATDLPAFSCLDNINISGFHIDVGGNPHLDANLINTPDELAKLQKPQMTDDDPRQLKHTLRTGISLHTNSSALFRDYCSLMSKVLTDEERKSMALKLLKSRADEYRHQFSQPFEKLKSIDLKNHFVQLLAYTLHDLAFYFGLYGGQDPNQQMQVACNTIDIVHALVREKVFTVQSGKLLEEALAAIYKIRLRLHFFAREQKEEAFLEADAPGNFVLQHREKEELSIAYAFIICPLYSLESMVSAPIDLIEIARGSLLAKQDWSALKRFQSRLISLLMRTQADASEHVKHYLALSQYSVLEDLRQDHLEQLNALLAKELSAIPNCAGVRRSFDLEEHALNEALLSYLTPQPPSTGQIVAVQIASHSQTFYLKPEVVQQLLDKEGNIITQYVDSRHKVARVCFEGCDLHFKQQPSEPLKEFAVRLLMHRLMGSVTPAMTLARFTLKTKAGKKIYPVLISQTIAGEKLSQTASYDHVHLTWLLLSLLLIRPGDGRHSNYVVDAQGRIFCIDNDVSFVELMVKGWLSEKTIFSSILFCLFHDFQLDREVIAEFKKLDPHLILKGVIEDLMKKEISFTQLFSDEDELRDLYQTNPLFAFTPTLLLREGTMMTIFLQFHHLQQSLKEGMKAIELLSLLLTLNADQMTQAHVGSKVMKAYRASLGADLKQQLKIATSSRQEKSMTSSQSLQASLGKIPTFEEIYKKKKYSLDKALKELLLIKIDNIEKGVSLITKGKTTTLQTHFDKVFVNDGSDIEWQTVILKGIALRLQQLKSQPEHIVLANARALNSSTLLPFLHKNLISLDVHHSPQLTRNDVIMISQKCPRLEKLNLSSCKGLRGIYQGTFFAAEAVVFPKLKTLKISYCDLEWLYLKAPILQELDACKNTHLQLGQPLLPVPSVINFKGCQHLENLSAFFALYFELPLQAEMSQLLVCLHGNDSRLAKVDLSEKGMGDREVAALAWAIQHNTFVQELDLHSNNIGDSGAKALCEALMFNNTLTKLDVKKNSITEPWAWKLKKLRSNLLVEVWTSSELQMGILHTTKINVSQKHLRRSYVNRSVPLIIPQPSPDPFGVKNVEQKDDEAFNLQFVPNNPVSIPDNFDLSDDIEIEQEKSSREERLEVLRQHYEVLNNNFDLFHPEDRLAALKETLERIDRIEQLMREAPPRLTDQGRAEYEKDLKNGEFK